MWQVIVAVIITFLVAIFATQNMHQVRINFLFTRGFQVRTIFLLLICFFLGFATSSIYWCRKYVKIRRKKESNK